MLSLRVYLILKRFFDVIASLVLILLFSWAFLLIILIYTFSFSFPVFFIQQRVGENESIFNLIKFRTLRNAQPEMSQQDAPLDYQLKVRRFPFGNFLRRTSLDELPQLLNVIKGEMSLVGPRPLPLEYLPLYSQEQRQRHAVKPGITGYAQVNGRHGISWKEKFNHDVYYVKHQSFLLDLNILFKTILLLLSFQEDKSLDEKKFTGNA